MDKQSKKRSRGDNENMAPLTEYELARAKRIQRNKQVLVDMGLENAAQSLINSMQQVKKHQRLKEPKDGIKKEHSEPSRRSRRLASQTAEAEQPESHFEQLSFGGRSRQVSSSVKLRRACSSQAVSQLDPNLHHQHNMHRINSMSEKALITRAWKITNVCKLKSFVEVLEAAGMVAVLQEAKAALAELTGGCS